MMELEQTSAIMYISPGETAIIRLPSPLEELQMFGVAAGDVTLKILDKGEKIHVHFPLRTTICTVPCESELSLLIKIADGDVLAAGFNVVTDQRCIPSWSPPLPPVQHDFMQY